VRYSVTSVGVAHRFPTYTTPRVTLVLQARDADGTVLVEDRHVIERNVVVDLSAQLFDTRLRPGEQATVSVRWKKRDLVAEVVGHLLVEPDAFYERFYEINTGHTEETSAAIAVAKKASHESVYVIGERRLKP
jgi:hypothetical protein